MLYGYVRVSTAEQNEARQLATMAEQGVAPENVYVDKASGKDLDRPAWAALMRVLRPGDQLLLDSLDRLGRNYDAVTAEWRRLTREVGVDVRCLDLSFFDSAGFRQMGEVGVCVEDMLLSLLAYVAQTERDKMLRRQAEGIAVAKAEGRYHGRAKGAHSAEDMAAAQSALDAGATRVEVASILGVHPNTVRNMVADGRLVAL